MLFNSVAFLFVFLPLVLALYFCLPHRWQNAFLVLASCIFYACWDWRFLAPLLFTTSLDYWISTQLENSHDPVQRKKLITISVVANLSLLGFFKYFNFFVLSAQAALIQLGFHPNIHTLNIVLPVAISFYTFQALSYTIDVYRGELHATRSFWDFFLAVLFFPHLVAGPIQRASLLLPQVTHPRTFKPQQVIEGLHLMAWGFFKKVFIADNLSPIVDRVFNTPNPTGGDTLIGVLAFTFQIYCDFSGYTDIARGIAKLMGFEFTLNFNLPYVSMNPSEFWRRWHISLSSWLRDYLYKPLGGNRHGKWMTHRNLMITMLLGGLWHGAAWNFVLWGFYHGAILVIHRITAPFLERVDGPAHPVKPLWVGIKWASMFLMTCYGWLLFRATSMAQILNMSAALMNPLDGLDTATLKYIGWIISPLVVVQLIQWRTHELFFLNPVRVHAAVRTVAYAGMLYMVIFLGGKAQSFVYFQF